ARSSVLPRRRGRRCGRSFRVRNRLASQFFGDIARRREGLLAEADRPFDEVVLELDPDLTQRIAQARLVADGDETAVPVDVDVFDASARQLLCLALTPDG